MPGWVVFYLLFIVLGGMISIYHYRERGSWFIIGESFSLLFTLMMFLYYYRLYPKPESSLVPLGMFLYILYWEMIENRELIIEELKKENMTKDEGIVMIAVFIAMFIPFFYVSGKLIANY